MYKERLGNMYRELPYWPSSAAIDWQKDRYAMDPNLMQEMLFISKESFFVGESGSKPTYMFEAPVGGEIELSVITHGKSDLRMQIFKNHELVPVENGNEIIFNTDGNTETTLKLQVKKGTKLYLVGYSKNISENREGWIFGTKVTYLSSNSEVESQSNGYAGRSFSIDIGENVWGQKSNNNWEFMYWDTVDKAFKSMAFVRSEGMFKGPSDAGYEYLMIKTMEMHPSVMGYPAKVFVAPADGKVQVQASGKMHNEAASLTKTGIRFMLNGKKVHPSNAQYVLMGDKETVVSATLDLKKGDKVAVVLDPIDSNIISDATNVFVVATYLTDTGTPGDSDEPSPNTGDWAHGFLPMLLVSAVVIGTVARRRRAD